MEVEIKKKEEVTGSYYMIPKSMFCKEVTMYDFLSVIFIQHFKSINNECIFTISLLLRYYGLDEHHRKIKHVSSGLMRLHNLDVIEVTSDFTNIDKHSIITTNFVNVTDGGSPKANGYVTLQYIEFEIIMSRSIATGNYNLLPVFLGIKRALSTINHNSNNFSSAKVTYKTITMNVGISSGVIIKECIDELCDLGILNCKVVIDEVNEDWTYHVYSVNKVEELLKLRGER